MKLWQKIIFWLLTADIIIGGFYWQWFYKLKIDPDYQSPFGVLDSLLGDLIMIAAWFYLLWIYIGKAGYRKHESPNTRQIEAKEKHLEQILVSFGAVDEITNDKVEQLLGVSDATAERYLNELEQMGKLAQIGKTGKYVIYRRI